MAAVIIFVYTVHIVLLGEVISLMLNTPSPRQREGPSVAFDCLAWVNLPGAYAPSSIAVQVTRTHTNPLTTLS
jgi:hypothetical protein